MSMVSDDVLGPAILAVLRSGTGAACDFGLTLRVYRLQSGRCWVTAESPSGESVWGNEYESDEEAVAAFLRLRRERRLGHDSWRPPAPGPWPRTVRADPASSR
jgi:hypothetical protein